MNNKEMIEIASIRLALIAPAINYTFTEESKSAYFRRRRYRRRRAEGL